MERTVTRQLLQDFCVRDRPDDISYISITAHLLLILDDLLLRSLLIHGRSIVLRQLTLSIHLLLAAVFNIVVFQSNALVDWAAADLCDGNGDEAAEGHADEVCQRAGEDTNQDGHEHGEEDAAENHVHVVAAVVAVGVVASHVVRAVVRMAGAEAVRRLALVKFAGHRVALVTLALVAAWAARVRLYAVESIGHDGLPLAVQRPFLALLVLAGRAVLDRCNGLEGGDHELAAGVFEEVDGEGGRRDGAAFDGGDLEGHGDELDASLGDGRGRGVVELVAGDAEGQVLAIGVDLGDLEGLGEVAKGRWVQLDAVDG